MNEIIVEFFSPGFKGLFLYFLTLRGAVGERGEDTFVTRGITISFAREIQSARIRITDRL